MENLQPIDRIRFWKKILWIYIAITAFYFGLTKIIKYLYPPYWLSDPPSTPIWLDFFLIVFWVSIFILSLLWLPRYIISRCIDIGRIGMGYVLWWISRVLLFFMAMNIILWYFFSIQYKIDRTLMKMSILPSSWYILFGILLVLTLLPTKEKFASE